MTTKTRDPRIGELRVAAVMHEGVHTCDRDAPLTEVAAIMAEQRIHCVIVASGSGDGGPLWGIVSDLDLVAAAMVRDLHDQTAAGSAATPVLMVSPRESLERAIQLMTEHGSSHLIVVDPGEQLPVGVVSTLDIAAVLAETGR